MSSSSFEKYSSAAACKPIQQGANAVYTENDCFSEGGDGLYNMEPGKCYTMNPDRIREGNNKGWVNNNAQDRWWWVETGCGETKPNGCLANPSLRKQRNTDYDNTVYENYELHSTPERYYDAMGRRTLTSPETRRALYLKKEKNIHAMDYEFKNILSGAVSFNQKTGIDGYVTALHNYDIRWNSNAPDNCICSPNTPVMVSVIINLSFSTTVSDIEYKENEELEAHENKHIEIYESLGYGNWEKVISIDFCNPKGMCERIKHISKEIYEEKLNMLVTAHNQWDDMDRKNTSHARISLEEKIIEMRKSVDETVNKYCTER